MPLITDIPCSRAIGDWSRYLQFTCEARFSALALEALPFVKEQNLALDIGAGAMPDSRFMLEQGFRRVVAIDASPAAQKYATEVAEKFGASRFSFENVRFSDFSGYEVETYDYVHANYSLPYHGKDGFTKLMDAVTQSVKLDGVFSGIFFGNEDGWKNTPEKIELPFLSQAEIEPFFRDFDFISLQEKKLNGHIRGGEGLTNEDTRPKFWHIFKVIARRTTPVL